MRKEKAVCDTVIVVFQQHNGFGTKNVNFYM